MNNMHLDNDVLNRYIDGEVSASESEEIRDHIEECEECAGYFHTLNGAIHRLKKVAGSVNEPDGVWNDIVNRLSRKSHVRWPVWTVGAFAAASLLLMTVLSPRDKTATAAIDTYVVSQISYMDGTELVDSWYTDYEESDVMDMFIMGEL